MPLPEFVADGDVVVEEALRILFGKDVAKNRLDAEHAKQTAWGGLKSNPLRDAGAG